MSGGTLPGTRCHVVAGVLGAAAVVFVGVAVGAVPAGAGAAGATPQASVSGLGQAAPAAEYTAIAVRIDLAPNGTAHWRVEYRYEFRDAAAERAFERASENVTNPPGEFVGRIRDGPVSRAAQRTGRRMTVRNGAVETVPGVGVGKVVYTFDWTNFAARADRDRYVVDAIAGMPFSERTQLRIAWPDGFRRASVAPEPDSTSANAVTWDAPRTFRPTEPNVTLVAAGGTKSSGLPMLPAAGALAFLLAVGVGWYGRSRWRDGGPGEADGDPERETPGELLSDEERVLGLLEEADGRMKQQDLNDAVEWSRTKTSDVVNRMHESDQIEVFRLGRENVLALPGEIDV